MKLVIAEKPSVAKSLAAVLGAVTRKDGYLEGGGWLVSWCLGHLAGLADAATYNPDYAKWRYDDLPILPESWRFTIAKDKRDQFDVLRTLLRREDVTEVVNACDAGREGRADFPHRLLPGGLYQTYETAVDQQYGGFRHPGGLCTPAPRRGL